MKCTCGGYRGYVHECVTVVVQEHVWVKPGYVPQGVYVRSVCVWGVLGGMCICKCICYGVRTYVWYVP